MIQCRQDVLRCVRPGNWALAAGTGFAYILSHLKTAAGEEHAAGSRPIAPPAEFIDARRAAEFAPYQHAHVLAQAPFVQVGDESGEAVVLKPQERAVAVEKGWQTLGARRVPQFQQ